jgi:hypothetical protein
VRSASSSVAFTGSIYCLLIVPVIKNFYAQLRARGKYPKSALTACMRKLLVILNAMLRSKISWQTPAGPEEIGAFRILGKAIESAMPVRPSFWLAYESVPSGPPCDSVFCRAERWSVEDAHCDSYGASAG